MSKKTDTTEDKKPNTVTVVAIAGELDMDPKIARARMRRIYRADDAPKSLPRPVKEGAWTFDAKDEQAIINLLTSTKAVSKASK